MRLFASHRAIFELKIFFVSFFLLREVAFLFIHKSENLSFSHSSFIREVGLHKDWFRVLLFEPDKRWWVIREKRVHYEFINNWQKIFIEEITTAKLFIVKKNNIIIAMQRRRIWWRSHARTQWEGKIDDDYKLSIKCVIIHVKTKQRKTILTRIPISNDRLARIACAIERHCVLMEHQIAGYRHTCTNIKKAYDFFCGCCSYFSFIYFLSFVLLVWLLIINWSLPYKWGVIAKEKLNPN